MSVINIYLNGSPLTSTKNIFLEKDSYIKRFKENNLLKRKLKSELFLPQRCLTENRFLNNPVLKEKDYAPKKKKMKRIKSDHYKRKNKRSRSISRSRDDQMLSMPVENANLFFESEDFDTMLQDESNEAVSFPLHFRSATEEQGEITIKNVSKKAVSCPLRFHRTSKIHQDVLDGNANFPAGLFNTAGMHQEKTHGKFGAFAFGSSSVCKPASASAFYKLRAVEKVPVVEKIISKMPVYNLEVIKLREETEYEFSYDSDDCSQNFFTNARNKKMQLLNVISMALLFSSNLKNEEDNYRIILQRSIDDVLLIEPEFILKVALYARQELQIRTISNFLLSYAAVHQNTRIYLEKYFEASIVLPSDWIQVAEYFQILSSGQNKQSFPAALRRVMKKSFQKFDKYQLAKYNRGNSKKKQKIEEVSDDRSDMMDKENTTDDDNENLKAVNKTFTLKKLIRSLHIDSPSEHVMCLLGKKYPKNHEEFVSSGLPGVWEPEKSGKRMKLPVPETWETRVSACGNKPDVWESLIDNQKLPYMAMLRNLKNLILSGISSLHHMKVVTNLKNKKYVIKSRQLPMQYFEAYKVLLKLQKMIEDKNIPSEENVSKSIPPWKKNMFQKMKQRIQHVSVSVVEEYKTAIGNALEISSMNNLHPIPGKTLIICQVDPEQLLSSAKIKSYETCIMMGLMCLKACEDCKMCIFSSLKEMDTISLKEEQFLDVLMKTCEKYEKLLSDSSTSLRKKPNNPVSELEAMLNSYLRSQSMLSLKLDHLIFLRMSGDMEEVVSSFRRKYRQLINSDLLYTCVDFNLRINSFAGGCISDKDAHVCGSSSSLIKFIAERSTGGQLFYVENIDVKYNLPEILESKYTRSVPSHRAEPKISTNLTSLSFNSKMPKWRTLRIFISSTFKDMMSERDLLIRYVFPELKRRAASVFARIVEIDLRWGITEADSATKRAAEICLREAQKADIFVGIIGDRYGSIYNFEPPDATDLDWVKDCPAGLSITELEIQAAALRNPQESRAKSFFYFRDNSFISHVPKKWAVYYEPEDFESKTKVDLLKQKIRSENFSILDGYCCHFAGIYENKPVLAGLEVLGNRILDDLWKVVQDIQKKDPYYNSLSDEEVHQQNLIESKSFFIDQKNFSRASVANKIVSKPGVFVLFGAVGCGKTTFLINLLPSLTAFTVLKFFIGISPRSRDLSYIIQYLCRCTCQELGISVPLPSLPADIVSYFPDFLLEASNCCGGREIIFIIDGLDRLEENDQRLDWLPLVLPKSIRVICSTAESSLAFKVLCERESLGNAVTFLEMPPLLQAEREQLVRNYLSYYRKALDESAFSNKMLRIVTKKESSNPFYLQIVCDFLRIYSSFETLDFMLQTLPSTTVLFFQEIILQMENEFGCGLIQTILILLCITKEGLEDADLHYIVSFAMSMNDLKTLPSFDELKGKIASLEPENLLCQVKYCSLMSIISTFAYGQLRQDSFSLVGTEFEKAVKKFYRNKSLSPFSKSLHCILAAYYHNVCDVTNDGTYKVRSGFAIRSLLYHFFSAGLHKELSEILCNVTFLKAVFLTGADGDLLEYYSSLLFDILPSDQKLSREIDHSRISSFYEFVSRNFHIFHQYPDLLVQQALNELSSMDDVKRNIHKSYLLENLSRANIVDCRLATLCGFSKNITAAADGKLGDVILGTEDGYLKVLDLKTRRVVRTIKAHSCKITHICCIGRDWMCVSSTDGSLSLWNTQNFSRLSVLYGHRHNVTCCCADPDGYIVYSSGWDNTVRLWSVKDGRPISVIEDFRCPVNWIDHHPRKQTIACGLWNGNIEIWDTVSIQKKMVLTSLNGSVQSLAFTQDGINIVSSYINSEISIWSSEEGLKMSCLKGHILPVKTFSSLLNDNIIISGSDDCTLKVWSTSYRSHFTTITDTKSCPVNLIEFISENFLAVAFQNAEISVFDINNGNVISKIALEMDVISVFSKYSSIRLNFQGSENYCSERLLVFGTQSGKLMSGHLSDSSVSTVAKFQSKITAAIHTCEIFICGTSEGDIGIFHPAEKLSNITYSAHKGFIGTFSLIEETEKLYLFSSANDNVLKLWNVDVYNFEMTCEKEFLNEHRDAITYSLFHSQPTSSEQVILLTGSYDNNVILWDEAGSSQVYQGLQSSVLKIACSGEYILGCGNDGALVMWHQNGTILTSIPGINQSSAILAFHITKDDSGQFAVTLAYVDLDGSIKINKPLQMAYYCSFDGHSKPITSCCATENKEVVSCSLDGSINLWKVPVDVSDEHFMHESGVTALILSSSFDFALSSDAYGNLIFWKIDLKSLTSPLTYTGKKKYDQCSIKGLSWLKNNKFACAVNQTTGSGEKNFLDVIQFDHSQKATFCLEVTKSYDFAYEVSCVDSCERTDGIVVGLKSGDVMYITPEAKKLFKLCDDWILGVCFFSKSKTSDTFCVSYIDGRITMFEVESFLSSKTKIPQPFKVFVPPHSDESSKFTSVMCCGEDEFICCGDSDGILRIYSQNILKFSKKVHGGLISGICVIGSYLFTCSLDKTVKGWSLKTFKQVCQFHSHTPVSCLSSVQRDLKESKKHSNILLVGTTSGNVHLLQFHSLQ